MKIEMHMSRAINYWLSVCHSSSSFRYMLSLLVNKQCHQVRKGFIAFLLDDIAWQQAMSSSKKTIKPFLTWWHCLLTSIDNMYLKGLDEWQPVKYPFFTGQAPVSMKLLFISENGFWTNAIEIPNILYCYVQKVDFVCFYIFSFCLRLLISTLPSSRVRRA